MQHYTSIEQSKKLLELGLNPESADMLYQEYETVEGDDYVYKHRLQPWYSNDIDGIPCWSVGALLEVIPKRIKVEGELTSTWQLKKEANGYAIYYESISLDWYSNCIGETLIEAAYNMIVWLLENEYIKKGEQL